MNKSILRILTWEDVKEIVTTVLSCDMPSGDDGYIEAVQRLRDKYDAIPPIEERYPPVLAGAECACGRKLTNTRERGNTLIRQFVAYRLYDEGYSYSEIGKMLKRDHSTVTNLVHRMRDMLSLPNAYKWEVQQYKRFEELL